MLKHILLFCVILATLHQFSNGLYTSGIDQLVEELSPEDLQILQAWLEQNQENAVGEMNEEKRNPFRQRQTFIESKRSPFMQRKAFIDSKRSPFMQRQAFMGNKRSPFMQRQNFMEGKRSPFAQRLNFMGY